MSNSFVLKNALVIDGTGNPGYQGDVVVNQGRIQEITQPGKSSGAGEQIEATNLAVAPGFIDMHSHSDLAVLQDKEHLAKTTQGVTLEVVGQDGLSYAPVNVETKAELAQQLAGWNGKPDLSDLDFSSIGEYLDRIDQGAALNVATLIPHGTLRMLVMGAQARYANENELAEMKTITEISMKEGAVGLSAGLTYTPAIYAHDDEIIELCKTVADHGGYYAPHHRNYGLGFLEAVDECLDISKKSNCALHLTHCHMSAPKFWGKASLLMDKLSQAKINGVDVSLDSYPYLAGMTYLHAFLPSWINEGGLKKAKERIQNSDARAKLVHELKVTGTDGNQGSPVNWAAVIIAHVNRPDNNSSIGMNLEQYAKSVNKDVAEAYLDLILDEDFESSCVIFAGNEENVREIMQHENHMIGSDGILFGKRPHPRAWGCFARILGVYGRDEKVISMEGAVARMTGRPATRLGLTDRGFIKPGFMADLVIFDPATVIDTATYEKPREQAQGIEHVFIAGQYVVKNRKRTDLVVGKSVRNPKYWSKS